MDRHQRPQNHLDEFRNQWLQEVQTQREAPLEHTTRRLPILSPTSLITERSPVLEPTSADDISPSSTSSMFLGRRLGSLSLEDDEHDMRVNENHSTPLLQITETEQTTSITVCAHSSVEQYKHGVICSAPKYCRRAFKTDSDNDVAHNQRYPAHIAATILHAETGSSKDAVIPNKRPTIHTGNQPLPSALPYKHPLGELLCRISNEHLEYIPREDDRPVLIRKLPHEIMQRVLEHLIIQSVASVVHFAVACKPFFLLAHSQSLWQYLCNHAFRKPYMTMEESRILQASHVERYGGHWLRMYIERPRLRYDGVYICTYKYTRMGESDVPFSRPFSTVTYYRYIRFFQNGRLLSYLSMDDPSQVIPLLTPGFQRRQVFRGRFEQREEGLYLEMVDRMQPKEHFRMTLVIKSTQRGRHDQLDWQDYSSATQGQEEEVFHYDVKMMQPFFFRVVGSDVWTDPVV